MVQFGGDMRRVYLSGRGVLSAAGSSFAENCRTLAAGKVPFRYQDGQYIACLTPETEQAIVSLRRDNPSLRKLDPTALLGILATRQALEECQNYSANWGVVFGSSRGPTHNLEQAIKDHASDKRLPAYTSPTTTANTIPSSIARFFRFNGMHLFVSAACSTGLHTVGLGSSLIRTGVLTGCIAGGAEASNTAFVREIMNRTKVTHKGNCESFPHRPMAPDRQGMVLGAGAGAVILESCPKHPICEVIGYGAATDEGSMAGVSEHGLGLQLAMKRSLKSANISAHEVDLIVGHGAGTKKGDAAEWEAIRAVFPGKLPDMTFHKWFTGHMLGASAASSIAFAAAHLSDQLPIEVPYLNSTSGQRRSSPRIAIILSLGFGGNAGALILRRL